MTRLYTTQTNFASGEVDPLMNFRSDTGAFNNGAATLKNAVLFNAGGEARRPGTTAGSTLLGHSRLVPFEFSVDERYVIAFTAGRIDVYDMDAALVVTVSTGGNWTADDLFEFSYSQIADTMIICHPSWAPQVILRTGAATFTITDFAFSQSVNDDKIYQPYFKFVDDAVTLSVSGTTGAGLTLTASSGVFTADMVGDRLRWQKNEIEVTGYTNTTTMTGTVHGTLEGEYDNNPFAVAEGSGTVEVTHVLHGFSTGASVTISGAGVTGGITAVQLNGAQTLTVLDDNTYSFASGGTATESIDGGGPVVKYTGSNLATRSWLEPAFAARNGYPGAVTFHEGRLWFGGSSGVPDGLWSSKLFDYFSFDVGDGSAADSIQLTAGASEVSNIRHLVSNNDLQIFTSTAEFIAKAPREESLSPASTVIQRQTPYGSSSVKPLVFDGATLYVQSAGTAVREYIYSDSTARYASSNLNILSSNIISTPYDMAVLYGGTDQSEQYAILINDNGTAAVFHSARSEKIAAWTPWALGGAGTPLFKAVAVVGEQVFFSVLRSSVYRLEKYSQNFAISVDGSTSYTAGVATKDWVVGAIYFGKTVAVTSGNYYLGEFLVGAAGALDVVVDVLSIRVGYTYEHTIKTLPIDVDLRVGRTTGQPKRISRVFVGLDSAQSLSVQGNRLILRQVDDDFSVDPVAITGTYEFRMLGWQKDAFVELIQPEPLPCKVLGLTLEVSV